MYGIYGRDQVFAFLSGRRDFETVVKFFESTCLPTMPLTKTDRKFDLFSSRALWVTGIVIIFVGKDESSKHDSKQFEDIIIIYFEPSMTTLIIKRI